MLIYHGTKTHRIQSIRKDGLRPRGTDPSMWTEHPSRDDVSYLTTFGHFFYGRDPNGLSVVEINLDTLDTRLLLPDEDYLHQIHGIPLDEARKQLEHFQFEWFASLSEFGTCAYKGTIPTSSICQYGFIDLRNHHILTGFYSLFEIMETGVDTFRDKGPLIAEVTRWVFNHTDVLASELKWDANKRSFIKLWYW